MKDFKNPKLVILFGVIITSVFLLNCSDNSTKERDEINAVEELNETEKGALLFMLDEEKLARDTYEFLDNQWGISQFSNIKKSEQSHMDAIINLLEINNIGYTILPYGEFEDQALQNYYNQFVESGQIS